MGNMAEKQPHLFRIGTKSTQNQTRGHEMVTTGSRIVSAALVLLRNWTQFAARGFHPHLVVHQRTRGMSRGCHRHTAQAKHLGKPTAAGIAHLSQEKVESRKGERVNSEKVNSKKLCISKIHQLQWICIEKLAHTWDLLSKRTALPLPSEDFSNPRSSLSSYFPLATGIGSLHLLIIPCSLLFLSHHADVHCRQDRYCTTHDVPA